MIKALVVDDEPLVTLLTSHELEQAGFAPHGVFNGKEALALLTKDRDWKLLVTDIRMPGLIDGWELGREALRLMPEIRVIYASGYADAPSQLSEREQFVTKPYLIEDLEKALRLLRFEIASIGSTDA